MSLEYIVVVVENTDREKFAKDLKQELEKYSEIQEPTKTDVSYSITHIYDDVCMYSALITMSKPREIF